jgi:hypothetical protein
MQGAKYTSPASEAISRASVLSASTSEWDQTSSFRSKASPRITSASIRAASRQFRWSSRPALNSTNDTGDFTLAAKFKLRNETRRGPSLGFRFGVQLPNSNQARGIGVNQQTRSARFWSARNSDPTGASTPSAISALRFSPRRPNCFHRTTSSPTASPASFASTNNSALLVKLTDAPTRVRATAHSAPSPTSEARLGMQIRASGLRFDFAGIKGLTSFSPNSGFTSASLTTHLPFLPQ